MGSTGKEVLEGRECLAQPNGAGASFRSRYLASAQYPEYRKLWASSLCSQSAAWALIVARAALVLGLTDSAAWTGVVTFAAMIPSVLFSPIAGYLADRFDRRIVLRYALTLNFGHSLLLAVLVATGWVETWHVLLLAIFNGSARAIQMAPAQALLANTVPRERLLNAVSLFQMTQQGSRFMGPFLILVILWTTGHQDWVFFLCSGLYAMSVALVFTIRTASTGVIESGKGMSTIFRNAAAGLHFMYHHPLVLPLTLLVIAHCGMTMSFESLFPVVSRDKLGLEGETGILGGASYLMVGFGLAAILSTFLVAGVQSERIRGHLFLWLGVSSGVAPIALAMAPNLPLAMVSAAGMGAAQSGFMALSHAMIQMIAPDAIRGRLVGVYTWHILGFMATFNMVNGSLANVSGITAPIVLGAGGIAFLIVMAGSFGIFQLRQLYDRGIPTEARAASAPAGD